MRTQKSIICIITFLLLWGSVSAQSAIADADQSMHSTDLSFKPIDIMTKPQTLQEIWSRHAFPKGDYSEREIITQTLINDSVSEAIVTFSPLEQEKEWIDIDFEEITPFTWKWVDLELVKGDGTLSRISLRRPNWWIQEMGADSIGEDVHLDMPEMGIQGWAVVKAIRINQLDTRFWDENREGDYVKRPITGKFEHESKDVYHLLFEGNPEPLGLTGSHPIWSVDRNRWVAASELKVNETVKTRNQTSTLQQKQKLAGSQTVHNLEVYKDHNFFVTTSELFVHNTCFPFKSLQGKSLNWIKKQKPKGWRTVKKDNGKGWKWLDENGNERLIYQRPSGENAINSQWSRMENGYFRRRNSAGDYLDIDGNVVPRTDPDFQFKTHIPYEGIH